MIFFKSSIPLFKEACLGTSRARKGQIEGDLVNGEAYCGSSAGLIKEILPAATVIERLVEEFQGIIKKMG